MHVPGRAPALLTALFLSVCATDGRAASLAAVGAGAGGSEDPLAIYVMTFGPGDHPFFKFGHDAIWIHDAEAGTDRVYNFGTFSFDSPRLILDFLHGRLIYWLSVSYLPATLASYERENRTIDVQRLALSPGVKQLLRARLDDNARPENRSYKYDYFLDNCATRVRDAIDAATGGRLRDSARAPARLTLRGQALRMTADYWPLYLALDIVLGPDTDRPIDRWAEMFIPQELARGLAAVTVDKPAAPRPLVEEARALFVARRPPPLEMPPARGSRFFALGCALGLALFLLGWASREGRLPRGARVACRALHGLLLAAWGFAAGFVGSFLLYIWALTDHVVAHRNQNILLFAPWALAFVVLGPGVAFGGPRARRAARALATAALAAAVAASLLKLGIARHQDNGRLLVLALPVWLGVRASLGRDTGLAPGGARRP